MQRALALLETHNGRCFVPAGNDLVEAFNDLSFLGLVVLTPQAGAYKGYSVESREEYDAAVFRERAAAFAR